MMEGGKPMSPGERSFTIEGSGTGFKGGRYRSKTGPLTAARKAGARLYRELTESQIKDRESKNKKNIKFILKETTRGSKKETMFFKVERIPLKNPIKRKNSSGGEYTIFFKFIATRCGSDMKLE